MRPHDLMRPQRDLRSWSSIREGDRSQVTSVQEMLLSPPQTGHPQTIWSRVSEWTEDVVALPLLWSQLLLSLLPVLSRNSLLISWS